MKEIAGAHVMERADYAVEEKDWGRLSWFTGANLGNSRELTVGECRIKPGCANPRHMHPNCEEVLHVLSGEIIHSIADGEPQRLSPGQSICVPAKVYHNARNVGDAEAVMLICFSSAVRQTVGE